MTPGPPAQYLTTRATPATQSPGVAIPERQAHAELYFFALLARFD
jgi:hypothetical protein